MSDDEKSDDGNPVLEGLHKIEQTFKGAYKTGERWGEETGVTPGWANAAHDVDPALAKSAADDWDKGDHAKAVGKFVYATGESIAAGVSDFIDGVTGHVDAVAPTIDIESHEDVSMRSSSVAHDDPPPPPPSDE